MSDSEKICVICGESCAGHPRTKDGSGRYYHKSCHDRALAKQQQKMEEPEPFGLSGLDSDDGGNMLSLLADEALSSPSTGAPPMASAAGCPSCGRAIAPGSVICMNCGYNLQTGAGATTKIKKDRSLPAGNVASGFLSPVAVGLGTLGLLIVLMVAGMQSSGAAAGFFAVYQILGLVLTVWAIVAGFRESIGYGIGALCCGIIAIYVVFAVNENPYLKWLMGAYLLAIPAFAIILVSNPELMETFGPPRGRGF